MDHDAYFGILQVYSTELVVSVIESLIRAGYLEKTEGMYPLLGITDKGRSSSRREAMMKQEETELQSYVALKAHNSVFKKSKSKKLPKEKSSSSTRTSSKKSTSGDTYATTLEWFRSGLSLKEIAAERDMTPITIESHLIKLYEKGDIVFDQLLDLTTRENMRIIQQLIQDEFTDNTGALKPIKERLESTESKHITYFEIKLAVSMIAKKDFIV
jgi:uncharacterized protein YpbB